MGLGNMAYPPHHPLSEIYNTHCYNILNAVRDLNKKPIHTNISYQYTPIRTAAIDRL